MLKLVSIIATFTIITGCYYNPESITASDKADEFCKCRGGINTIEYDYGFSDYYVICNSGETLLLTLEGISARCIND